MSPEPGDSPLVPVGYLSKAHGIRGEMVLVLEADSPELLKGGIVLRPRGSGKERRLEVERTRVHHGNLLVCFKGVTTRNEAELLSRHTVLAPKDRLPALEDGEMYLSDLPGLRVLVADGGCSDSPEKTAGQGGRELGVIASVAVPAGQEIWTIVTPGGGEILFPAVDQFVISIDPERKEAVIAPPPGLIELYLSDSGS